MLTLAIVTCKKLDEFIQSLFVPLHNLFIVHHPQALLVCIHSVHLQATVLTIN